MFLLLSLPSLTDKMTETPVVTMQYFQVHQKAPDQNDNTVESLKHGTEGNSRVG